MLAGSPHAGLAMKNTQRESKMQIALYEPEIPPNTGTIARLCAAATTRLNLIEPLGFSLDDKYLKRAGLDYWPHVDKRIWPSWDAFLKGRDPGRLVFTSARQGVAHHRFSFEADDIIVLGPETRGLPPEVLQGAGTWSAFPSGARSEASIWPMPRPCFFTKPIVRPGNWTCARTAQAPPNQRRRTCPTRSTTCR
jgi:tRNA (cytidine/uridine-2'-O-)-methyltransferase